MGVLGRRWRLFILIAVFASIAALGFDWPLRPFALAAHFGSAAHERPVLGALVSAEAGLVRASGGGTLVYAREHSDARTSLPSTLGSFAFVEQNDGLLALYGHVAPRSIPSYLKELKEGEAIGAAGESGITDGKGCLFSLFDRKAGRWVNPLLLLPPLPEKEAPLVRQASLVGSSRSYIIGEAKSVPQGTYALGLDISDPVRAPWNTGHSAPYYIRVLIDGAKYAELRYEVIELRNGELDVFPGAKGARARFAGNSIALDPRAFPRGKTNIEALVRDYAGNEKNYSWSVSIE